MLTMVGSIIKQIVMPIITPFLSAFIGYFVAIKIFEKQEKTKGAINKVNNANELFIKAMFIHIRLVAVRRNYYENVNKINDSRYRWMNYNLVWKPLPGSQ